MRWTWKSRRTNGYTWWPGFAWYPVRVVDDWNYSHRISHWVWLERVEYAGQWGARDYRLPEKEAA